MTYGVFIVLWHFFSCLMKMILDVAIVKHSLNNVVAPGISWEFSINRGHRWILKRISDKATLLFLLSYDYYQINLFSAHSIYLINNNFSEQFKTSHLRIVFKSCLLTLVINMLNYLVSIRFSIIILDTFLKSSNKYYFCIINPIRGKYILYVW